MGVRDVGALCPHCGHFVDWHLAAAIVGHDDGWEPEMGDPYRCRSCGCLVTVGADDELVRVGGDPQVTDQGK